jgi:Nif-specific regulatory protein
MLAEIENDSRNCSASFMESNDATLSSVDFPPNAVLILSRGAARLDVIELRPSQRLTVGRSPTNQIVVPDPKCSRQHCELFVQNGDWVLRDLGSKNGVSVDGTLVRKDWPLEFGQVIQIGEHSPKFLPPQQLEAEHPPQPLAGTSYVIVDRKSGTLFDRPAAVAARPASVKPFIDLIRLGRAMNEASEVEELVECALEGLTQGTPVSTGAVLLARQEGIVESSGDLEMVGAIGADRGREEPYSRYLTDLVLREREAVLVHDVSADSSLSQRKSLQDLAVTSAICAPVRHEGIVLGVLHLYASDPTQPLASDHLDFALAVADQMGTVLPTIRRHEAVVHRLEAAKSELRELLEIETELVGESESIQKLKRAVARVAPTDATVLIRGESGVGKELVARAVHFNSARREGPFVCVNCAALTESLLESELFGHEKGAFTGASNQKPGKFEQAHGGTLFLDEVGEMSPEIQAKFLRVLEGQAFERVGGGKAINVDVRVVTATNRDLEDAVREGKFRQDLFYRLQVIEVMVPPLRTHPEDVPALAQHFVDRFSRKAVTKVRGFNRAAIEKLMRHPWPGNVRELRNVVERAVILSERPVLTPDDIQLSRLHPPEMAPTVQDMAALSEGAAEARELAQDTVLGNAAIWRSYMERELTLDDIDRMYMEAVLDRFNWNKSQASRLLGIERTTLDRRLKKYGLSRPGR